MSPTTHTHKQSVTRKILLAIAAIAMSLYLALNLSACSGSQTENSSSSSDQTATQTQNNDDTQSADESDSSAQDSDNSDASTTQDQSKDSSTSKKSSSKVTNTTHGVSTTSWSAKEAPNYVERAGKATVKDKPAKGKIAYSNLDSQGRTRAVYGNITYAMVETSAGWRQKFESGSDPSGWGDNAEVSIELANGRTYHGWLYNRSHLIADSLGGRSFRQNVVTGTRMQNVGSNDGKGGMAYCERKAVNWLKNNQNGSLYYAATPKYVGDELVPRSVIVDMKSSDNSINDRYVVYNAANGYKINYKTGSWSKGKTVEYGEE